MIVDWEPHPIFQKQTGNTAPLPKPYTQTTHYLTSVTKCILDTELYMKVVQKEVANVSSPIARIVPSTVAASSGTAMRHWEQRSKHQICISGFSAVLRSISGKRVVIKLFVWSKQIQQFIEKSQESSVNLPPNDTYVCFCLNNPNHYYRNLTVAKPPKTNIDTSSNGFEKMTPALNLAIVICVNFQKVSGIYSKNHRKKTMAVKPLETNSPCKTHTGFQNPEACETWKMSLIS